MRRVMCVDDDANLLQALQRELRTFAQAEQLVFELYTSAIDAINRLKEAQFCIVIVDYQMPSMRGTDFLTLTKAMQPEAIRFMLSASDDFKILLDAINEAEVCRYIKKPWNIVELEEVSRLALVQYEDALHTRRLEDDFKLLNHAMTLQEWEAKKLEMEEPGITLVKRASDGSILLE